VLVPGDRAISWPKLRRLLGVSRLSMPDAEVAKQATGYERGTITPFGSARPWPVIADERMRDRTITLGAGEHGLALAADADAILRALDASVADTPDPEPATSAATPAPAPVTGTPGEQDRALLPQSPPVTAASRGGRTSPPDCAALPSGRR
jgi:hypothetical protein